MTARALVAALVILAFPVVAQTASSPPLADSLLSSSCQPIPGAEAILSSTTTHFVTVGEVHGTMEAPSAFADLVCSAVAVRRSVVVALEYESSGRLALNEYLRSKDPKADERLMQDSLWFGGTQDGRKSLAYLGLLQTLRELQQAGKIGRIIALDPGSIGNERDEVMGRRLLSETSADVDSLILLFCGNVHAAKKPVLSTKPLGAYLPADRTTSLLISDQGGTAWYCTTDGCGSHQTGVSSKKERGVYMGEAWLPGYDGILAVGSTTHYSPPAYLHYR